MKYNAHTKIGQIGFTLIELLVVLAIVAVLASILLSVLSGAKERARRTACQSNLKQIALAMQQYVQDNGGVYPLNKRTYDRDGVTYSFDWSQAVSPYLKEDYVFRCPDIPADAPWHMGSRTGVGNPDYNYDWGWLNSFLPPYPTKRVQGVRESTLLTPSSIWLNEDISWISLDGECHYCRLTPKSSCGKQGGGSTLHSGGGNYSYVDGHVKWLTPEEAGEVECLNGPLPAPFKD